MQNTTTATCPFSYSKPCDTFRPRIRQSAAIRTGLGGKAFVYFLEPRAMLNSLVREHVTEGRPACVKYRFGHAGLGKSGRTNITDSYVIELAHDATRKLLQEITTRISYASMDICYLPTLASPLSLCQRLLKISKVSRILNLFSGGKTGKLFQPKIDADSSFNVPSWSVRQFDNDIQKPVPSPITREICTVFDLSFRKRSRVENSKRVSREPEGAPFSL
ncbi:hypothetical protein QOZ48_30085 [Pseudomonas aeruginosa]